MKTSFLILLSILMMKSCDEESKQQMDEVFIQYTATTRGFHRVVTVENQSAKIYKERHDKEIPQTIKLSETQKKAIADAFRKIDLENMPNLKAPSEKRFFDGAAIATLKIIYEGKEYNSQPFDHLNPPAEIAGLVGILAEYTKREE